MEKHVLLIVNRRDIISFFSEKAQIQHFISDVPVLRQLPHRS